LETYLYPLKALEKFADGKRWDLRSMSEEKILTFLTHRKNKGLSASTMFLTALTVRLFYRFLAKRRLIDQDPTSSLSLPRIEESIPDPVTPPDMEKLLAEPVIEKYSLWRTHLLAELAYQSGLRASEVTSLRLDQVNLNGGFIRIKGKRRKERLVPLGPRIIEKLGRYLAIRAKAFPGNDGFLFLSQRGKPIDRKVFWWLLKRLAKRVGIKAAVSPHKLRHAFATDLMTNGTSMRALQILLSHENLKTTERYSHVNLGFLRESISKHPRFG
jgi:integrase/recombinase XerD